MILLYLILFGVCLGYLGLGSRTNLIVAIVLLIVGALIVFAGWDGALTVRVD